MNMFVSEEKLEEVAILAALCGDTELENWCDQALDGSEEANALVLRILQEWDEEREVYERFEKGNV